MGHAEFTLRNQPAQKPLSLDEFWMPFTPNRDFKADPKIVVRAEGMYYWNDRGEKIIDASSGLFCVAAGHGRREIAEAVHRQLSELDFVAPFLRAHPKSFELATRVAELTPGDLNRVFFVNSGSESVDTAMKVALAYHQARGQSGRTMFVSRERAYHGVNFGGVALSGIVNNRRKYGPGIAGVVHMRHTHLKENLYAPGQGTHGADLADDLTRFVNLYGAENIAACFVEPIAGSTGCLVPPQGYLQRLRQICDTHGILLVCDEIQCGVGRTGKMWATEFAGIEPDILLTAKGLASGMPLGAIIAKDSITKWENGAHGSTFGGNPVACAAAMATLDVVEQELLPKVPALGDRLIGAMRELQAKHPSIGDVRGKGLMIGVEFVKDRATREPAPELARALIDTAFEQGLLLLTCGKSTLRLAPPLVIDEQDIDIAVAIIDRALTSLT